MFHINIIPNGILFLSGFFFLDLNPVRDGIKPGKFIHIFKRIPDEISFIKIYIEF